jgi:hypothetical protein
LTPKTTTKIYNYLTSYEIRIKVVYKQLYIIYILTAKSVVKRPKAKNVAKAFILSCTVVIEVPLPCSGEQQMKTVSS